MINQSQCLFVVPAAPTVEIGTPAQQQYRVGATVELRCVARGNPAPRVRWDRENGPMPDEHSIRNGVLT